MGKIIHEELSSKIIGAAMAVLNELKPGLDDKLNRSGLDLALLLNFKSARLECKRVLRLQPTDESDPPDLHA
jgi:hypothetical protein